MRISKSIAIGRQGAPTSSGDTSTALDYVDPGKVLQYVRSDLGITKDGSNRVSAWADQSGAGLDYTQALGTAQPLWLATGGPNGTPAVQLDSSARKMLSALDLPTPATTPTLIWMVMVQDSYSDGSYICTGGGANHMNLWQRTATPNTIKQYDGGHANDNTAAAIGVWFRLASLFSNSVSDYVKILSTLVTGASAGNIEPSPGRALGALSGGSPSALTRYCEVLYLSADLSAGEASALDAYVTSRYGPGLV